MIKRSLTSDKSGQEGITIGTLLLIVLGVVVVAVIILGVTGTFDFIFGKINLVPGQDLEAVAQSCIIASESKLAVDFCQFKKLEIDGKTDYVNCQDDRLKPSYNAKNVNTSAISANCDKDAVQKQCTSLYNSGTSSVQADLCSGKVLVNGNSCTKSLSNKCVPPS